MAPQKTMNTQRNLELEKSWSPHSCWFQTILQNYNDQNTMALAWSRKQTWEATKETRIFSGEWIVSSINSIGKTGYPYAKEWNWTSILHHLQNVNSQWFKNLIVRPETVKFKKSPRPWLLLLLLLSHFSRVWLCVIPETAAHQALLSVGVSRQERWSGLPFPSPMHESEKWKWSRSVLSDSSQPHGLQPTTLLHP